jgi:hypothetical protein
MARREDTVDRPATRPLFRVPDARVRDAFIEVGGPH